MRSAYVILVCAGTLLVSLEAMAEEWYRPIAALLDNATYKAEGYITVFTQTVNDEFREIDNRPVQVWSKLSIETYTEFRDGLIFNLSGHAVLSTQKDELHGVFTPPRNRQPEARFLDLREVYLRLEKESLNLTIGKALLPMGLSTLYSPADRYSFVNGANPLHPQDYGMWQVGLDYFIKDDTLSFVVVPFEERPQSPTRRSRWLGGSGDDAFFRLDLPSVAGAVPSIREEFGSAEPENFGYLLKYSGVREGFDFFGSLHIGPSVYPVIRTEGGESFVKETPTAFTGAGGVTATFGAWEFHGEATYQITLRERDQDFLKFVVGLSYRETDLANAIGLEEILPILEYARDVILDDQDATNFVVSSAGARPHSNSLLYKLDIRRDDKWSYRIAGAYNFRNTDSAIGGEVEHSPTDNLTFKLTVQFYEGPDDSHFGRWRENDNVTLGIIYTF